MRADNFHNSYHPVLIVEREPSIRLLLCTNLNIRGYATVEAPTAEQAYTPLASYSPSLMILEVEQCGRKWLPGSQELLLHATGKSIPIIVISTQTIPVEELQALNSDVAAVLLKPITIMNLIAQVKATLKVRRGTENS